MSSTGDIKNNLRKLKSALDSIHYEADLDLENIIRGVTSSLLPPLHYLFVDYSPEYSQYLADRGYELYGKNDAKFIEVVFKIVLQEFSMKPMLTKEQFFCVGFAEIKVIFVTKIIQMSKQKNDSLTKKHTRKKWAPSSSLTGKSLKFKMDKNPLLNTVSSLSQNLQNQKGSSQSQKSVKPMPHEQIDSTTSSNVDTMPRSTSAQPSQVSRPLFETPLPLPELALTPIKAQSKDDTSKKTTVTSRIEMDYDNVKETDNQRHFEEIEQSNDFNDLDDTYDIEEVTEDLGVVKQGTVEVIDADDTSVLPLCSVVKHIDKVSNSISSMASRIGFIESQLPNVSIDKDVTKLPMPQGFPNIQTRDSSVGQANSNVSMVQGLPNFQTRNSNSTQEQQVHQCKGCADNSKLINTLSSKLSGMESAFKDIVSMNHELSSRVVLLETQLKLLADRDKGDLEPSRNVPEASGGSSKGHALDSNDIIRAKVTLPLQDKENVPPRILTRSAQKKSVHFEEDYNKHSNPSEQVKNLASSNLHSSNFVVNDLAFSHDNASLAALTVKEPERPFYSPIKYTDDDDILKNFKPIRMRDLQTMTIAEKPSKISKSNTDVVTTEPSIESTTVSEEQSLAEVDTLLTRKPSDLSLSCDLSLVFESDSTKKAILNVKNRLKETKQMLQVPS